jgi:hypothetical protein
MISGISTKMLRRLHDRKERASERPNEIFVVLETYSTDPYCALGLEECNNASLLILT